MHLEQIKGTGLANRCPEVSEQAAGGVIKFDADKKYKISELCLEPKSWQIEEEVTKRRGETKKGEMIPFFACLVFHPRFVLECSHASRRDALMVAVQCKL